MRLSISETALDAAPGETISAGGFQVVNPCDVQNWEKLVRAQPGHTIFHSAAWARVLQETYGYTPLYFTLRDQAHLSALFPLMEVNSWLTGRRGVSLPFTDECRPLLSAGIEFSELLDEIIHFGRNRAWKHLEWRGTPTRLPGNIFPSLQFYHHWLDLSPGEEKLFAHFSSPVRRAIRKAENSGLIIEISSSLAAVAAYFALHCKTRKKHGMPPQPFSFFKNIHRFILSAGGGFIVLARLKEKLPLEGRLVAGAVFLQTGGNAIFKFGASDERFQSLRGNNLVMWQGIKHLAQSGCELLDFGRTSIGQEGLRRYKLGWGALEGVTDYFHYELRVRQFQRKIDRAAGVHAKIFKVLPLKLSTCIGNHLYKHLA